MYHLMYHFKSSHFVAWHVDVFQLTHVKGSLHLNSLKPLSLLWRHKHFSESWELRIFVVFRWILSFNVCWRKYWGSSQVTSWYCMLPTQPSQFIFIKIFLLSTGWHKKRVEKPNKNWRNPRKKIIDRNWTITTCLLREYATHTGWHKRTGTFEMRRGSERMHTWRMTPSTGRNFQTLIIWITVS